MPNQNLRAPMKRSQLIRLAAKADLASLQAIERAASTLFPAARIPDLDDAMPAGDLEQATDDGLLFVATSEDSVVGFAMAHMLDDSLYLAVMAVHPDHGNQGLGRKLVDAICAEAARRRHSAVTLTTFEDLPWNGPFYRKAGFRALGDEELSPSLRAILVQEARLGMVNRIAMQRKIAAVV